MKFLQSLLIAALMSAATLATASGVLVWDIDQDLESSYSTVYETLEEHKFFVVFEPDIQRNISRFAERWGDNYNRNKLEDIRAMVFCNAWYTNEVSNADPDMMAMCPLHITLVQKQGKTRILFIKPTHIARGSVAMKVATTLEKDVSAALDEAAAALNTGTGGK